MIGTLTFEQTNGKRTIDATPFGLLNPPPSNPSTTRPSTPASIALSAAEREGIT